MSTAKSSTTRGRKRVARRPYCGPRCPACGRFTLVALSVLSECLLWVIVCDGCAEELDRFIATDGRCAYYRIN